MTKAETSSLVAEMMRKWPHAAERLAGQDDGYAEALADIDAAHARAALEAWSRDGEKWPPSSGELRAKLVDLLLDVPEWWQVKAALTGVTPVPEGAPEMPEECPYGDCDGDGWVVDVDTNTASPCRCRPERQAIRRARRAQHPLVAEFIRRVGSREVEDIEGDRTAEAQVREKWVAFVTGARRHLTYQGIEPAGLPALERVASSKPRQLGPHKLDAAGLLGAGGGR